MQLLKPAWIAAEGNPIFCVDIHPDGSRFATGGQASGDSAVGRICLWNLAPVLSEEKERDADVPKMLSQMDRHLGCVNCLRWSPTGTFLASGADDKLVMIWRKSGGGGGAIFGGGGKVNVESWRCVHTLSAHSGDVLDLAWSEGDRLLATASVDNTVIVWNGDKLPEIVTVLKSHSGMAKGVTFDPVGRFLASQSDDKTLRVWRISDWKEETCVSKPFAECGATTHVLRPGWSPDGSMVVSAHAMNEGGPTAQIIDRGTWATKKDFVGHKKAVTCVRFNGNILQKKQSDENKRFVMVALGSRDRSFSVWSTNLRRPLFVITDAFEQSVLDLSWSRDGKVLLACSMDGTIAAVILKQSELGHPFSEDKKNDFLIQTYGKSFGLPAIKTKHKTQETNGAGPVVVENPDLLLKPSSSTSSNHTSGTEKKKQPRGRTDKQIEARTSDGKRRITPIFIPPDDTSQGFGSGEFQSTSTRDTSSIAVEKREGIVEPNVSPSGKVRKANSTSASNSSSSSAGATTASTSSSPPKAKAKEATEKAEESDDGINVIPIRRKKRVISSDNETDNEEEKVKESSNKISTQATKEVETPAKFKELSNAKPNLLVAKRKADGREDESAKPKKRGRPPLIKSKDEEVSLEPSFVRANDAPAPSVVHAPVIELRSSSEALSSNAVLPPLIITRPRNIAFNRNGKGKASLQIFNHFKKVGEKNFVHLVKFMEYQEDVGSSQGSQTEISKVLLPSPVNSATLACHSKVVVVTCLDASLHLFSPEGNRMFPPIMLCSPVSNIVVSEELFAAVTTVGKFFLWRLKEDRQFRPEIIIRNECILSLLERGSETDAGKEPVLIARLSLEALGDGAAAHSKPVPVLVTSVGRSYVFDEFIGTWLKLADADSAVSCASSCSDPSLPLKGSKKAASAMPLAAISLATPSSLSTTSDDPELRCLSDVAYCESQVSAAVYLNSHEEYKHWLITLAAKLTAVSDANAEAKLRNILDSLLNGGNESKVLDLLDRKELMKDVLSAIGRGGVSFQRLCAEYQEILAVKENANQDKDEEGLDDILHAGTDFAAAMDNVEKPEPETMEL